MPPDDLDDILEGPQFAGRSRTDWSERSTRSYEQGASRPSSPAGSTNYASRIPKADVPLETPGKAWMPLVQGVVDRRTSQYHDWLGIGPYHFGVPTAEIRKAVDEGYNAGTFRAGETTYTQLADALWQMYAPGYETYTEAVKRRNRQREAGAEKELLMSPMYFRRQSGFSQQQLISGRPSSTLDRQPFSNMPAYRSTDLPLSSTDYYPIELLGYTSLPRDAQGRYYSTWATPDAAGAYDPNAQGKFVKRTAGQSKTTDPVTGLGTAFGAARAASMRPGALSPWPEDVQPVRGFWTKYDVSSVGGGIFYDPAQVTGGSGIAQKKLMWGPGHEQRDLPSIEELRKQYIGREYAPGAAVGLFPEHTGWTDVHDVRRVLEITPIPGEAGETAGVHVLFQRQVAPQNLVIKQEFAKSQFHPGAFVSDIRGAGGELMNVPMVGGFKSIVPLFASYLYGLPREQIEAKFAAAGIPGPIPTSFQELGPRSLQYLKQVVERDIDPDFRLRMGYVPQVMSTEMLQTRLGRQPDESGYPSALFMRGAGDTAFTRITSAAQVPEYSRGMHYVYEQHWGIEATVGVQVGREWNPAHRPQGGYRELESIRRQDPEYFNEIMATPGVAESRAAGQSAHLSWLASLYGGQWPGARPMLGAREMAQEQLDATAQILSVQNELLSGTSTPIRGQLQERVLKMMAGSQKWSGPLTFTDPIAGSVTTMPAKDVLAYGAQGEVEEENLSRIVRLTSTLFEQWASGASVGGLINQYRDVIAEQNMGKAVRQKMAGAPLPVSAKAISRYSDALAPNEVYVPGLPAGAPVQVFRFPLGERGLAQELYVKNISDVKAVRAGILSMLPSEMAAEQTKQLRLGAPDDMKAEAATIREMVASGQMTSAEGAEKLNRLLVDYTVSERDVYRQLQPMIYGSPWMAPKVAGDQDSDKWYAKYRQGWRIQGTYVYNARGEKVAKVATQDMLNQIWEQGSALGSQDIRDDWATYMTPEEARTAFRQYLDRGWLKPEEYAANVQRGAVMGTMIGRLYNMGERGVIAADLGGDPTAQAVARRIHAALYAPAQAYAMPPEEAMRYVNFMRSKVETGMTVDPYTGKRVTVPGGRGGHAVIAGLTQSVLQWRKLAMTPLASESMGSPLTQDQRTAQILAHYIGPAGSPEEMKELERIAGQMVERPGDPSVMKDWLNQILYRGPTKTELAAGQTERVYRGMHHWLATSVAGATYGSQMLFGMRERAKEAGVSLPHYWAAWFGYFNEEGYVSTKDMPYSQSTLDRAGRAIARMEDIAARASLTSSYNRDPYEEAQVLAKLEKREVAKRPAGQAPEFFVPPEMAATMSPEPIGATWKGLVGETTVTTREATPVIPGGESRKPAGAVGVTPATEQLLRMFRGEESAFDASRVELESRFVSPSRVGIPTGLALKYAITDALGVKSEAAVFGTAAHSAIEAEIKRNQSRYKSMVISEQFMQTPLALFPGTENPNVLIRGKPDIAIPSADLLQGRIIDVKTGESASPTDTALRAQLTLYQMQLEHLQGGKFGKFPNLGVIIPTKTQMEERRLMIDRARELGLGDPALWSEHEEMGPWLSDWASRVLTNQELPVEALSMPELAKYMKQELGRRRRIEVQARKAAEDIGGPLDLGPLPSNKDIWKEIKYRLGIQGRDLEDYDPEFLGEEPEGAATDTAFEQAALATRRSATLAQQTPAQQLAKKRPGGAYQAATGVTQTTVARQRSQPIGAGVMDIDLKPKTLEEIAAEDAREKARIEAYILSGSTPEQHIRAAHDETPASLTAKQAASVQSVSARQEEILQQNVSAHQSREQQLIAEREAKRKAFVEQQNVYRASRGLPLLGQEETPSAPTRAPLIERLAGTITRVMAMKSPSRVIKEQAAASMFDTEGNRIADVPALPGGGDSGQGPPSPPTTTATPAADEPPRTRDTNVGAGVEDTVTEVGGGPDESGTSRGLPATRSKGYWEAMARATDSLNDFRETMGRLVDSNKKMHTASKKTISLLNQTASVYEKMADLGTQLGMMQKVPTGGGTIPRDVMLKALSAGDISQELQDEAATMRVQAAEKQMNLLRQQAEPASFWDKLAYRGGVRPMVEGPGGEVTLAPGGAGAIFGNLQRNLLSGWGMFYISRMFNIATGAAKRGLQAYAADQQAMYSAQYTAGLQGAAMAPAARDFLTMQAGIQQRWSQVGQAVYHTWGDLLTGGAGGVTGEALGIGAAVGLPAAGAAGMTGWALRSTGTGALATMAPWAALAVGLGMAGYARVQQMEGRRADVGGRVQQAMTEQLAAFSPEPPLVAPSVVFGQGTFLNRDQPGAEWLSFADVGGFSITRDLETGELSATPYGITGSTTSRMRKGAAVGARLRQALGLDFPDKAASVEDLTGFVKDVKIPWGSEQVPQEGLTSEEKRVIEEAIAKLDPTQAATMRGVREAWPSVIAGLRGIRGLSPEGQLAAISSYARNVTSLNEWMPFDTAADITGRLLRYADEGALPPGAVGIVGAMEAAGGQPIPFAEAYAQTQPGGLLQSPRGVYTGIGLARATPSYLHDIYGERFLDWSAYKNVFEAMGVAPPEPEFTTQYRYQGRGQRRAAPALGSLAGKRVRLTGDYLYQGTRFSDIDEYTWNLGNQYMAQAVQGMQYGVMPSAEGLGQVLSGDVTAQAQAFGALQLATGAGAGLRSAVFSMGATPEVSLDISYQLAPRGQQAQRWGGALVNASPWAISMALTPQRAARAGTYTPAELREAMKTGDVLAPPGGEFAQAMMEAGISAPINIETGQYYQVEQMREAQEESRQYARQYQRDMLGLSRQAMQENYAYGDIRLGFQAQRAEIGYRYGMARAALGLEGLQMRADQFAEQQQMARASAGQQYAHFVQRWELQGLGLTMQKQQFMAQWETAGERQAIQYGWQQQDWAYNQNVRQLQFGWRMEDMQEQIRFATGRQRHQLMRQRGRETTMYTMETAQAEEQKDRMEEQREWQIEDHERQKEFFEERLALQVMEHELALQQAQERMGLQEKQFQMAEEHFNEQQDLQRRQYDLTMGQLGEEYRLSEEERTAAKTHNDEMLRIDTEKVTKQEEYNGWLEDHEDDVIAIQEFWEDNTTAITNFFEIELPVLINNNLKNPFITAIVAIENRVNQMVSNVGGSTTTNLPQEGEERWVNGVHQIYQNGQWVTVPADDDTGATTTEETGWTGVSQDQVGRGYVAETGLTVVHRGEVITPAHIVENEYIRSQSGGHNEEVVVLLRAILSVLQSNKGLTINVGSDTVRNGIEAGLNLSQKSSAVWRAS